MRFAQLLSSHLTPEWRAHYIDYKGLKSLIYKIVSSDWTKKDDHGMLVY
jgi:SPX domain protein involved in polyphosphate accumulation